MGIKEDDVARVRAATDFIAVASEHIALKRVGQNYQGLCPFHSEKTPSFSINPGKGVYFCYGCGAKGDVITFVRELEHLDFAGAVEKLAARANLTVEYDSEAFSKDRVRRNQLVDAMERAVEWYHQRLLTGADAGKARAYLRSRGYDREAIERFRIGWAPEGWDTLVRALNLSTDVARDTGLGYLNKIGKVNDFFQSRILFPIFDVSGNPIAFGGRKLPDADGPKYKNSSETKLYSKSRTLYGLNWAKAGVVNAGQVVVCEGYTDVIAMHRAGLPIAVATCGTALADEHFRTLKNFARRIVLAYDADNAGQSAAAKFYEWEQKYEIDLAVVALPEGADPADLAREDPARLKQAVDEARPFLEFRVERMLREANLRTVEGRARAYQAAAAAIMEHPNAIVREQYLTKVASQCQISEDTMAATLAGGRRAASGSATGGAGGPSGGRQRRAGGDRDGSRGERTRGGAERVVANEDPGAAPPEAYGAGDPGPEDRGGGWSGGRGVGSSGRGGPAPRPGRVRGRATSPGMLAAAAERASRAELEVLRWALADPDHVIAWLDASFFADPVRSCAFDLLLEHGDLRAAADAVDAGGADLPELAADAVDLLHRLAVETPVTPADDAIALLVGNCVARVLGTLAATPTMAVETMQEIPNLKLLVEALHDPVSRAGAVAQLVPWLVGWSRQQD